MSEVSASDELLDSVMAERAAALDELRADREAVEAIPPAPLVELNVRITKRAFNALGALRKVLKCGAGPIITRALSELASRELPKKGKKHRGR